MKKNKNRKEIAMNEIITADCDINENGLIAYFGGNGDVYISVSTVDENGLRTYNPVRISTSGGSCPANIKIAAAELARAFEENEE